MWPAAFLYGFVSLNGGCFRLRCTAGNAVRSSGVNKSDGRRRLGPYTIFLYDHSMAQGGGHTTWGAYGR